MASTCGSCGISLSFVQRLTGKSLCKECSSKQKQDIAIAEEEYEATLSQLASSSIPVSEISEKLSVLEDRVGLSEAKLHTLHLNSFRDYIDEALDDDHLTEEEEARLFEIGSALSIDVNSELQDVMAHLLVAKVNNGRLPTVSEPHVMLKKAEVAHAEMNAALLKEVKIREYQGGYSGVSFRIAKGVRYHTGGTRGRSVVVDTKMEVADEGILSLTSQRAVYIGGRKTIEMPYKKLVNLNVFADGVQFHLSNRNNPPIFRLQEGYGDAVAAIVNQASQPYLE